MNKTSNKTVIPAKAGIHGFPLETCGNDVHVPIILMVVYLVFYSGIIFAGYKMGTGKPVKIEPFENRRAPSEAGKSPALKRTSAGKFDETPVLVHLSEKYRVDINQLQYFRKLKYGYEELVPSIIVGAAANVQIGRILSQRDRGKSWKQIADTFSVDLKPLNKKVVEELKPLQKILPAEILKERPTYINNDGK